MLTLFKVLPNRGQPDHGHRRGPNLASQHAVSAPRDSPAALAAARAGRVCPLLRWVNAGTDVEHGQTDGMTRAGQTEKRRRFSHASTQQVTMVAAPVDVTDARNV